MVLKLVFASCTRALSAPASAFKCNNTHVHIHKYKIHIGFWPVLPANSFEIRFEFRCDESSPMIYIQ